MPTLTDADPAIPALPEPYSVASTLKCVACSAPYQPSRVKAPFAAYGGFSPPLVSSACKCGSSTFGGTVSSDSLSPAEYTGAQMNTRWLDGYAAGRAAGVQGEAELWVLTSEYNDYDQHGAYFRRAWSRKPDREEVRAEVITERGGCSDSLLDHILSGGGQMDGEHVWFNLEKQS